MQQGGIGWLAIVGLGRARTRAIYNKDDAVATVPATAINHFLHDAGKIRGLVLFANGVPGGNIAPGDAGDCFCPIAHVIGRSAKARRVVAGLRPKGDVGGAAPLFVCFKLNVGVGNGGSLWDLDIWKTQPNGLLAQRGWVVA